MSLVKKKKLACLPCYSSHWLGSVTSTFFETKGWSSVKGQSFVSPVLGTAAFVISSKGAPSEIDELWTKYREELCTIVYALLRRRIMVPCINQRHGSCRIRLGVRLRQFSAIVLLDRLENALPLHYHSGTCISSFSYFCASKT